MATVIVMAAGIGGRQFLKLVFREALHVFPYGPGNGTVDSYARAVQTRNGPAADPADDQRVDATPAQRLQRIAGAVGVVLIPVIDRLGVFRLGIIQEKIRGRSEVRIRLAGQALILKCGNANLHAVLL